MKDQQLHLQKVNKTLNFVAQKLNTLNIKWFLGASGALMVHGLDVIPWDLDIFTTAKNVKILEKEFKKYVINPLHYFDQVNQKELEFQMKINDIAVEICELSDFSNLQIINFQGISIPVNSLQTELNFYQNRQGKEEIVKLIKEKLNREKPDDQQKYLF